MELRRRWNSAAMEGDPLFQPLGCSLSPGSLPSGAWTTPAPQVYPPSHTPQGSEGTFCIFRGVGGNRSHEQDKLAGCRPPRRSFPHPGHPGGTAGPITCLEQDGGGVAWVPRRVCSRGSTSQPQPRRFSAASCALCCPWSVTLTM